MWDSEATRANGTCVNVEWLEAVAMDSDVAVLAAAVPNIPIAASPVELADVNDGLQSSSPFTQSEAVPKWSAYDEMDPDDDDDPFDDDDDDDDDFFADDDDDDDEIDDDDDDDDDFDLEDDLVDCCGVSVGIVSR